VTGFTPGPAERLRRATTARREQNQRRRGTVTTEMMLALPVLLITMFGTIQFSMVLFAKQQVQAASREAARTAARGGVQSDVEHVAKHYLDTAGLGGATVDVGNVDANGNLVDPGGNPIACGDPVTVEVHLKGSTAAPRLLRVVGLRFLERDIIARTVMCKE
jgi:Flp pilus assembly protein TadG